MSLKEQVNLDLLPKHVAIVMDGNGRWAKKQGEKREIGHAYGVKSLRVIVETAAEIGVKYLTLYTFSTENWNRPTEEVNAIMNLLVHTINAETDTLNKNNIRLQAIGDLNSLPADCYKELQEAIESTKNNTRMTMVIALSYSARWEIKNAMKEIAQKIERNELSSADISEETISEHLCTSDMPDPELLIRTGKEFRISNFLLWQIAYSELYFTDVLWPDFNNETFYAALIEYQSRERRFGKTSEQLT
jgi:undecaprenyl diphosphate synthase